jgi:hypothetical protein
MKPWPIALFLLIGLSLFGGEKQQKQRQQRHWTEAEAQQWYAREAWPVGANYIFSTASNQLEMWRAETFDAPTIERELGMAEDLGMNAMRVFLHYMVWHKDPGAFKHRVNAYLKMADFHHIKTVFVLFDSCWDPFPELGPQRPPQPGIHNSRWVQSPGAKPLMDPRETGDVLAYVQDIVQEYRDDKRVLAWDVWNEPDNRNEASYGAAEPANKLALVEALLPKVFTYARAGLPEQPLTSGLWHGDWSDPAKLTAIEKIQLDYSDVISFHNYDKPEEFERRVLTLEARHRPILCTEYMARPRGSTFQSILPIAKRHNVAAFNWGFVAGKTQTYLPWDSWQHPYIDKQPAEWFHDVFRQDGTPYSAAEVAFLKQILERPKPVKGSHK